jgi:hypothetical protein
MATILPFLKDQSVFEPETTQAMASAFEEICRVLNLAESATRERETVASRIVDLARRGERNSLKLTERVLRDAGASPASSSLRAEA